jgi:hypothetical protein
MRLEAEREVARLSAQKRAEMRNADGVTRQMACLLFLVRVILVRALDLPIESTLFCTTGRAW